MPNNVIRLERMVGDRLTPISAKLVQNGAAVNLTGKSVLFTMIAKSGAVKVAETAATIDTAASGLVSYAPTEDDVDTAGEYLAWFIVVGTGDKRDTFPHDGPKFVIVFNAVPTESTP